MGMPKALLKLDDRPILEYLLREFAWPGQTLLVTAPGREHPPGADRFGREAIDPVAGQGPLRGVLTALEHLTTPLLLVLTVDMPAIRLDHCLPLLDALRNSPDTIGAMFRRAPQTRGDLAIASQTSANPADSDAIEPFPLALKSSAASTVKRRLERGRKSVHGLLEEPGFVPIEAPAKWDAGVWANLNAPEDLRCGDREQ